MSYSESEYSPLFVDSNGLQTKISTTNDVRIVEPNPIGQIVPHEDLFIYVSLVAKQKSKSVITETDNKQGVTIENSLRNEVNLAVPQRQIPTTVSDSLLFGPKATLGTDWTEIGGWKSPADKLYKDLEGFGITNIDVEIKSQTAPKVVIDFIDVRGATLFEQGSCSPYGLFFNMPYPIFELTLKGYYGKAVKYYLHLISFKSKFNSDTGNMECRAEFIGYTFAFLSDIIVSYVRASQNLLEDTYRPQEILEEKYEETRKFYEDNGYEVGGSGINGSPWCGNPKSLSARKCTTILDLLTSLKNFEDIDKPNIAGSDEFNELQDLITLESNYQSYLKQILELQRDLNTAKSTKSMDVKPTQALSDSVKGQPLLYVFKKDILESPSADQDNIDDYPIDRYFNKSTGIFLTSIRSILETKIGPKKLLVNDVTGISCLLKDTKQFETNPSAASYPLYDNEELNKNAWFIGILKSIKPSYQPVTNEAELQKSLDQTLYPENWSGDTTVSGEYIVKSVLDLGYLLEDANRELDLLNNPQTGILTEKRKTVTEAVNAIVEERIGFKPSIRNIFTVLLCNTDAFMQILLEVAVRAEKYHDSENLEELQNNNQLISGKKVFPWPTYIEKIEQGTKEVYPGKRFPSWPEVIFVEDFIKAYLKTLEQNDILNEKTEGKPGYDNFVPINPLESQYWEVGTPTPIKYFGLGGIDEIDVVVGERMFISLDHSLFQPVRLTPDATYIPNIGKKANWSPLKKANLLKQSGFVEQIARVDAWNLVNAIDNLTLLDGYVAEGLEATQFIDRIKLNLKKAANDNGGLWSEVTAKDIKRDAPELDLTIIDFILEDALGFGNTDKYYAFKTYDEGIVLKKGVDNDIIVKPNPFDMIGTNTLIKIVPEEQKNKKIKLTNDGFIKAVEDYRSGLLTETSAINFGSLQYENGSDNFPSSTVSWDDSQQIFNFEAMPLYTTLGMSVDTDAKFSSWWTSSQLQAPTDGVSGKFVSNMGMITFWNDHIGTSNDPNLISFLAVSIDNNLERDGKTLTPPLTKFQIWNDINGKRSDLDEITLFGEGTGNSDPKVTPWKREGPSLFTKGGIATPFVTTPLWLDNVNKFRKFRGDSYGDLASAGLSPEDEAKNLAYLFLQTTKTTPLIQRFIKKDGYFVSVEDTEDGVIFNKDFGSPSVVWSLKAFNITSGVAKVPKAWLLSLGAQLWRWREFIGSKKGEKWIKPLTCIKCPAGQIPKGKDPLVQPGFNSFNLSGRTRGDVGDENETLFRNNVENKYLNLVYDASFNTDLSTTMKYKSVFSNFYQSEYYFLGVKSGINGGTSDDYMFFRYYNLYTKNVGEIGNYLYDASINPTEVLDYYAWPQVYIAPHHIPYVSTNTWAEPTLGEGSAFTMVTDNWIGYQDYITIMPNTRNGKRYLELDGTSLFPDDVDTDDERASRSLYEDGNLGMVIQYLPDAIKDEFVQIFEDWALGDWKSNILPIVDPINFGTAGTNKLTQSYEYQTGANSPAAQQAITSGGIGSGYVLALKDNSKLSELFSQKYWILNSTPKIWYGIGNPNDYSGTIDPSNQFYSDGFVVSDIQLQKYLTTFLATFKEARKSRKEELEKQQKENPNASKGLDETPLDDDDIKLSLYRTFKSLTDKWISASSSGKLFFNLTYSSEGKGCGPNGTGPKSTLASHFQYINRVMGDIGDIAVIDITKLNELRDNLKISLYQYLSDLLVDNEYLFFPLPTYVNFSSRGLNDKDVLDMFRPSLLDINDISCGPLFLCMYVGGTSRQLKFKTQVDCPYDQKEIDALTNVADDGFGFSDINKPDEIANPKAYKSDGYTAFRVVYGLENQNHFTNIQLDQSEFSETAESILVIDKLSQRGGSDKTTKGQNLNAVNLTRSYTCNMESLGNMMIQPMSYFDLQGVPMFSGAYLITEVRHNFKPNHATTSFKGTRQPRATVPVVTDVAVAMNLTFKGTGTNTGSLSQWGERSNFSGGVLLFKVPKQPGGIGSVLVANTTAAEVSGANIDTYGNKLGITDKTDDGTTFKPNQPSKPIGNITNSAYANINVSTRTIPNTEGGNLGCASAVSIIFYRATGYGIVGESYITLGTSSIYDSLDAESTKSNSSWEKITDWRTGCQAGDIICTARLNSETPGHIGVVVLNNDIVSNSSDGFDGDNKGQIEKNYTITGWEKVAKRNPTKTVCFRYKGPYADSWGATTNNNLTEKELYDKLNSSIKNSNLVYGIMGNFKSESRLNTNAKGDKRPLSGKTEVTGINDGSNKYYCSWGYSQLYVCGGRGDNFLKEQGLTDASDVEKIKALTDPTKHLDYVIKEVGKLYGGGKLPITETDSVENWTKRFAKDYERCAGCDDGNSGEVQKRIGFANEFSTKIS